MITFRKDTSFPFLKIARDEGVPYEKVLRVAEAFEPDSDLNAIHADMTITDELIYLVAIAVMRENKRRRDAGSV